MSSPFGFATLPANEATRALARHPELADEDAANQVVLLVTARDGKEAAELADLLAVARKALRTRDTAAHEVLAALLPADRLTISGAHLRQVQRNAEAHEQLALEFGLLSSAEVAAQARSRAENAAALASRWRKLGQVFSVDVEGSARYPGFQFGENGKPRPVIAEVLKAFDDRLSDWETALWFTGGNDWLGGARPVDALVGTESDLMEVPRAARRLADELTR